MGAVTGLEAFTAALQSRVLEAEAVTHLAVKAAADVLVRETVDKLMLKEHPRHTPTPSQPGEPPAMITGALMASVHATEAIGTGGYFEARVGPATPYARIQELGGEAGHGSRLPARPYLKPALEEATPKIAAIFLAHWIALNNGL